MPSAHVPKYPRNATLLSWIPIQEVGRYGYQGPPGFNADLAAASRNGRRGFIVPPDQMPVFEGSVKSLNGVPVPPGGCYAALKQKINLGAPRVRVDPEDPSVQPEQGIEYFQIRANFQARSDRRFRALLGKWSACMARSGLNYDSPDSAEGDPRWADANENGERHKPGAAELTTATTDERCRAEVNFSGVLQALISAYELRQIKAHGEVIRGVQKLLRVQVGNAASLTGPPADTVP
ncbi:hypothetical protein FXF68_09760 [Actinomadura decatromicini]|uniref:Uncharacterized protein n=1 Tax=Actinomadura decatromicini TaxID=2604572 RepID=A0A5D3FS79_9ACTN|nr:hypothetical protein FXF68_09760 [Actinomadura decatromicini]